MLQERKEQASFKTLDKALHDEEVKSQLMRSFTSEPIDNYLTALMVDDIRLTIKEALNVDLTEYLYLDFLYRWLNAQDVAVNITGRPGKGKSNIMLQLMYKWCTITGKPFRLSNVVYYTAIWNLLLKGYKVEETGKSVRLKDFELQRGEAIGLDEASDLTIAGPLSMTTALQNRDIEARMRALQVGRFASGTRPIQHEAYYNIWTIERDPVAKLCTGIVYATESNDPISPVHNLGFITIPYIDFKIFEAYNKPKLRSIQGYGRNEGGNIVARVIKHFAEELREDKEYQSLPAKPPNVRINWLQSNEKYSIFNTISYFNDLEKLGRPLIEAGKNTVSRRMPLGKRRI